MSAAIFIIVHNKRYMYRKRMRPNPRFAVLNQLPSEPSARSRPYACQIYLLSWPLKLEFFVFSHARVRPLT
jgi:hypothetical protein